MLRCGDGEATSSGLEVARGWLLEDSTGPVGGVVDMSSVVVRAFNELGILLEVAADLDQRLGPVAASTISARLDTLSEGRRTSQGCASKGSRDECNGELHVDGYKELAG